MSFDSSLIKNIFSDDFKLPIRWDGNDFVSTLNCLYNLYHSKVISCIGPCSLSANIKHICDTTINTIKLYFDGKPTEAFNLFDELFRLTLMENPLYIFDGQQFDPNLFNNNDRHKSTKLYRARKVTENKIYTREDVFHTPYTLRNKISTNRYSIAGYPSLYLSSTPELCLAELDYKFNPGRYIGSRFEIARSDFGIRILEMGIKPTDFIKSEESKRDSKKSRAYLIDSKLMGTPKFIQSYLLWFPVIAACSFMRINKDDPFSCEYIIPQLIMQCIRLFRADRVIIGIRYFSCNSYYASELGYNYVFPTIFSTGDIKYSSRLKTVFRCTNPLFLSDYENVQDWSTALRLSNAGNI